MTPPLAFSTAVAEAIAARRPLVALESTIITHGMPHPENLATARAVEAEIAAAGAVPATIAVMEGRIHIGLEPDRLERLAAAARRPQALARRPRRRPQPRAGPAPPPSPPR